MPDVINPCPTCGKRFDFPITGCMTMVEEWLTNSTGGKCPGCGTLVVVDELPPREAYVCPLERAETDAQRRAVPIVDLPLSVRCRLLVHRLSVANLGELLAKPQDAVRESLGESKFQQVQELLDRFHMKWSVDVDRD